VNDQIKHYSDKLAYEIDPWDLQVALDAGEKITVVDARSSEAFQREHIPGAINVPHRTMTAESTRHIVIEVVAPNQVAPGRVSDATLRIKGRRA
jgi:rhodanese-related sulfurtransferase